MAACQDAGGPGPDTATQERVEPLEMEAARKESGCASANSQGYECRICLTTDNQHDIVQPCNCTGTVQYAHLECLRSWCVNNLSLKCEICGSVYKDEVVKSLMGTLIEAQDRQVAAQGLSNEEGIRLDVLDAAARQRENANGDAAGEPMDPAAAAEAHQRMQAFLEELLQIYATRSEFMLARSNQNAFPPQPLVQQRRPQQATAAYTCAAALLLLWMLMFVILSRLFTKDYVRNAAVATGTLVLFIIAAIYFRSRCNTGSSTEQPVDTPFGRRARELERERRYAQQTRNPPIIRIIR